MLNVKAAKKMRIEELSHTLESVCCKDGIFGLDVSACVCTSAEMTSQL